jgi:hypothetical protein
VYEVMTMAEEIRKICYPVHADDVREGFKLAFEAVKNISTLSAGSLVLIATFLKDIFDNELATGDKVLVSLSFLCFAVSLVLAAFSMWRLSTLIRSRREYITKKRKIRWNIVYPSASYILGLSFFGTAVLSNLFYGGKDKAPDFHYIPLIEVPWIPFVVLGCFILVVSLLFKKRLEKGQTRDEVVYEVLYPDGQSLHKLPDPKQVDSGVTYSEESDEAEELPSS